MSDTCPLTSRGAGYVLRCIRPAGHIGDCWAALIEYESQDA